MPEKYIYLVLAIESMAALGVVAALVTRSSRVPFLLGFNTMLPVAIILCLYGDGALWRKIMILAFVMLYLVRMSYTLLFWFGATGASKVESKTGLATLALLPVVLANVFGWLYCLPFFATVERAGPFNLYDAAAIAVYILGTTFHFGADLQKWRFKQNPGNRGRLLQHGLWGLSRHPNYFGDFLIYVSFTISSAWVWGLLAPLANLVQYFGDALPKNEKMAFERYGEKWERYSERVPVFFPALAPRRVP